MAIGKGASMVGGSMIATKSLVNGDYGKAAINGGAIILGSRASKIISNTKSLSPLSRNIFDGNITLKINGLARILDR